MSTTPKPPSTTWPPPEWVRAHENIHLIGPAGTGQSHLLVGPSRATVGARQQFATADMVKTLYRRLAANSAGQVTDQLLRSEPGIGDGLGFAHLDLTSTRTLFRFVAAAQGWRSLAGPSHGPFDQRAHLLSEQTTAVPMIDRLPRYATTVVTGAASYRMRPANTTEVPGPATALSYRPFPDQRKPLPAASALVAPHPPAAFCHLAIWPSPSSSLVGQDLSHPPPVAEQQQSRKR